MRTKASIHHGMLLDNFAKDQLHPPPPPPGYQSYITQRLFTLEMVFDVKGCNTGVLSLHNYIYDNLITEQMWHTALAMPFAI